jgi:hypothetical protein
MATPDTDCDAPEGTRSDSTRPGNVLNSSRVSEQRFGIMEMDLKFCSPRRSRHKLYQITTVLLYVAVSGSQSTHRRAPAWWHTCSWSAEMSLTQG